MTRRIVQSEVAGGSSVGDEVFVRKNAQVVPFVRLGGRLVPYKSSPRCRVCQLPNRMEIDSYILLGRSYQTILMELPESCREGGDEHITYRMFRRHVNEHIVGDVSVRNAYIEERAKKTGAILEQIEGSLVDHWVFANEVMRRSFEGMVNRETPPTIEEGLSAAKALADWEMRMDSPVDSSVYIDAFVIFFDVLRSRVSEEWMQDFMVLLRNHPVLHGLMARARGQVVESSAIES